MTKTEYSRTIRLENIIANPDGRSLFDFIGGALAVLWKGWPKIMDVSGFSGPEDGRFTLRGECPHCRHKAAFLPVTNSLHDERQLMDRWVAALQCTACREFILGIIGFPGSVGLGGPLQCLAVYPLGQPDDYVSSAVPEPIADDFREALRCRWIKAFKATVLMCRRSLQTSCDMA
ncbi:MAG TPA: hypothetical protein VGV68_12175, partial [Terriglobia bacterium]|nr:hypothetical protein [Terriglobia bacterium]